MLYPPHFRIIRLPCTVHVNPKYILAAFRHGAGGVWVSGCHPGGRHYIEGNLYARRKIALLKIGLEHTGIESRWLHFSWISSAEVTKFAETPRGVVSSVEETGQAQRFIKKHAEVR